MRTLSLARSLFALPLLTAGFSSLPTLQAQVQATSVRVAIGFGVDTLGSNHEVFALWRTYLSSGPGCTQEKSTLVAHRTGSQALGVNRKPFSLRPPTC
jgi:hypothetical protein